MAKLINPLGRVVNMTERFARYYSSKKGWKVIDDVPEPELNEDGEQGESVKYTVRQVQQMTAEMSEQERCDFIRKDPRKSVQALR